MRETANNDKNVLSAMAIPIIVVPGESNFNPKHAREDREHAQPEILYNRLHVPDVRLYPKFPRGKGKDEVVGSCGKRVWVLTIHCQSNVDECRISCKEEENLSKTPWSGPNVTCFVAESQHIVINLKIRSRLDQEASRIVTHK